jgi:hypothetical protein
MRQTSLRRILCSAACLMWADHAPGQQPGSGGIKAAPSAVIDFSLAGQTIPARKLPADPATCVVGEQYFNTTSSVLKICTAANSWTSGQPVLLPGKGIIHQGAAISVDTAVMLSQSTAQAGTPWKCTDAGRSGTTYSCVMQPAPSSYYDKEPFIFTPATSCAGGPTTLNVYSLGAKRIYKIDGTTDPAPFDCRGGQPLLLLYNASLDSGNGAFQMASLLGNASFLPLPAGLTLTAASTISPISAIHHIRGATQINTIAVPSQFVAGGMGGCLRLIPDSPFTTGTSGNIAVASTAIVSRMLEFCYDNATGKWYPSY